MRRLGVDLRPVQADVAQLEYTYQLRVQQDLHEQLPDFGQKGISKISERGGRHGRRSIQGYGWPGAEPDDQSGQSRRGDHRPDWGAVRGSKRHNTICSLGSWPRVDWRAGLGGDALEGSCGKLIDYNFKYGKYCPYFMVGYILSMGIERRIGDS